MRAKKYIITKCNYYRVREKFGESKLTFNKFIHCKVPRQVIYQMKALKILNGITVSIIENTPAYKNIGLVER